MSPHVPYADLPPFRSHAVSVEGGHVLHVDEFGTPDGIPALVLHGGPGSGVSPLQRRFFDPARYRVVCPDQRGAGRSQPAGAVHCNTTPHLLDDLRLLRHHLGIERWLVVGGSWGATLAVLHAAAEPAAVGGMLLRSAFLARPEDVAEFFADIDLEGLLASTQTASAPLSLLAAALSHADPAVRRAAARCWQRHELGRSGRAVTLAHRAPDPEVDAWVQRYRVQAHYLQNGCWLPRALLQRCGEVPKMPTLLIHGTDDRVCAPAGAVALRDALPGSALQWVPGCGHDLAHPSMVDAMVRALDAHAAAGHFSGGSAETTAGGGPP